MTALPPPGRNERGFVALFLGSHLVFAICYAIANAFP